MAWGARNFAYTDVVVVGSRERLPYMYTPLSSNQSSSSSFFAKGFKTIFGHIPNHFHIDFSSICMWGAPKAPKRKTFMLASMVLKSSSVCNQLPLIAQ